MAEPIIDSQQSNRARLHRCKESNTSPNVDTLRIHTNTIATSPQTQHHPSSSSSQLSSAAAPFHPSSQPFLYQSRRLRPFRPSRHAARLQALSTPQVTSKPSAQSQFLQECAKFASTANEFEPLLQPTPPTTVPPSSSSSSSSSSPSSSTTTYYYYYHYY